MKYRLSPQAIFHRIPLLSSQYSYNTNITNTTLMHVSQVQITDFAELYDCLLDQQRRHYPAYSAVQQTLVLHSLLRLARTWAAVEHRRFNMIDQGEREAVFPINSEHCASSAQSILDLSLHIGELATASLARALERQEETDVLVSTVFVQYKLTQEVMLEHEVPVRLEVPTAYFHAAAVSHNAVLVDQVGLVMSEASRILTISKCLV